MEPKLTGWVIQLATFPFRFAVPAMIHALAITSAETIRFSAGPFSISAGTSPPIAETTPSSAGTTPVTSGCSPPFTGRESATAGSKVATAGSKAATAGNDIFSSRSGAGGSAGRTLTLFPLLLMILSNNAESCRHSAAGSQRRWLPAHTRHVRRNARNARGWGNNSLMTLSMWEKVMDQLHSTWFRCGWWPDHDCFARDVNDNLWCGENGRITLNMRDVCKLPGTHSTCMHEFSLGWRFPSNILFSSAKNRRLLIWQYSSNVLILFRRNLNFSRTSIFMSEWFKSLRPSVAVY